MLNGISQYAVWERPPTGWLKCNVDASFSKKSNKVEIGVCLRHDCGVLIGACTHCFSPMMEVSLGESLGLLLAIN